MSKTVATPTDKPTTKRVSDLEPGDWIAAGHFEDVDGPVKVMGVYPYAGFKPQVMLVGAPPTPSGAPLTDYPYADAALKLATEEEVTAAKAMGRRMAFAEQLRAIGDLIASRDVPLTQNLTMSIRCESLAEVERVGELIGVKPVGPDTCGGTDVEWPPQPDYSTERHVQIRWYWYDPTFKKAVALKPEAVPAEPTGLDYSREADDPTPVSPARVPLHTGAMVDGNKLVDETEPATTRTAGRLK